MGLTFTSEQKRCVKGTKKWAAPEALLGDATTEASDIHSLGTVLWELVNDPYRLPFHNLTREQLVLRKCFIKKPEKFPDNCLPLLKELISLCWEYEPEKRPSAKLIADVLEAALKNPDELETASIASLGFAELFKKEESNSVQPACELKPESTPLKPPIPKKLITDEQPIPVVAPTPIILPSSAGLFSSTGATNNQREKNKLSANTKAGELKSESIPSVASVPLKSTINEQPKPETPVTSPRLFSSKTPHVPTYYVHTTDNDNCCLIL